MSNIGAEALQLFGVVRALCSSLRPGRSGETLVRFEWLVTCGRILIPNYRFK